MSANEISSAVRARVLDMEKLKPLMQVGWVAKGVVYGLMGIIAIPIAVNGGGGSGDEASQQGALAEISNTTGGTVLLVIMAIGLLLYALWRLTTACLPGDNSEAKTWAHRVGWLFSAIVYGFLAVSSISFVVSSGGSSGSESGSSSGGQSTVEEISASLLESTGGRWLLGFGALVALAVAGYFAYKGVQRTYLDDIDLASATSIEQTVMTKLGVLGWIGRSVTVGLIAVFVLRSAITADPDEAEGLDGALREIASQWWGVLLILVAGFGLLAYGIHAAVSARHRRLLGP